MSASPRARGRSRTWSTFARPISWSPPPRTGRASSFSMAAYVVLTAVLFQRGSAEIEGPRCRRRSSRPPSRSGTSRRAMARAARGWILSVLLQVAVAHLDDTVRDLIRSPRDRRSRRVQRRTRQRGIEPVSPVAYTRTARFWFESLQNWQSEFLGGAECRGAVDLPAAPGVA
jgi:hypothetical protein